MLLKKPISPYNRIESFFSEDYNEKNFLVFFRIMISLIAIIEIASLAADLPLFFSSSDTIIPQELMYVQTGYFRYIYPLHQFFKNHDMSGYFYQGSVSLYISSLILLLTGFLTRYAACIALVFQLLIFKSFSPFNYGYDNFLTMSLFYCIVFPVGKYYAIDSRLFKRAHVNKFNYQHVLQLHLAITYFFSGIAKALDMKWWDGNSLWNAIASVDNGYFSIPPIILIVAGIGTILLELLYPLLVLFKTTRKYTIAGVLVMHLSIAVVMDLYAFSAIMVVWNIAAFGDLTIKNKTTNADIT